MSDPKMFSSWKVVLLSFVAAATFWFFRALGKDYTYRFKYPIEFSYNSDSLVAVRDLPQYVDIDVSGLGWDLLRESFWFGANPVIFELDNPTGTRFLSRSTILPIITEQLYQYEINFLFTDTLYIDIDRRSSKLVNLKIDSMKLSLDNDYRIVTSIVLDPDTAVIYAPTSFLDTLDGEYIIQLEAKEVDKDFNRFVGLGLPNFFGIYSEPATINVKFGVERFKKLEIMTTIKMINFPHDSSVYVADPDVIIQCVVKESQRQDYTSNDFNVIVDYKMIHKADSTAPPIVLLYPDGLEELKVIPDSVKIHYAK